jgi:hypothetical protein
MKHILLSLLLIGPASIAYSEAPQPTPSDDTQQIHALPGSESNQALLAEYAAAIKKMREDMGLPEAAPLDPDASPEPNTDSEDPLSKIKLRVISGSEGIPFPSPEQVIMEPTPTQQIWPTETPQPTPTPWRPPGRCPKSASAKTAIVPETADNEVLNDKLFLPEDFMPMDESEVYGAGVSLYPYGPNQGEGQYLVQEIYLVPCLPYRIRQTPWGYFEHRGDDALKRYGSSGMSSSTFHPWVEQKLYGTTKKSPRRR